MKSGNYHPLLDLPAASPGFVCIDVLHTVDHDGVGSHCIGNAAFEMIQDKVFPGCRTIADSMSFINQRCDFWKSERGMSGDIPKLKQLHLVTLFLFCTLSPCPSLLEAMTFYTLLSGSHGMEIHCGYMSVLWFRYTHFCTDGNVHGSFPLFHGQTIKAATTRAIAPFMKELCEEFNDGSDHDKHRLKVLEYLVEFYSIIADVEPFFAPKTAKRFKFVIVQLLKHYSWLAQEAQIKSLLRWKVELKHHYFFHMALRHMEMNPKFCSCYMDESMIGRMTKILGSCLDGPFENTYQTAAFEKYLLWLTIDLGG